MINFDLRSLLIPKKLTLNDLAEMSGVNYWTICHMSQRTYKSIKISDIQKICKALDISPNELFGYEKVLND
jgi:Predicted transcriptional regulator